MTVRGEIPRPEPATGTTNPSWPARATRGFFMERHMKDFVREMKEKGFEVVEGREPTPEELEKMEIQRQELQKFLNLVDEIDTRARKSDLVIR